MSIFSTCCSFNGLQSSIVWVSAKTFWLEGVIKEGGAGGAITSVFSTLTQIKLQIYGLPTFLSGIQDARFWLEEYW